MTIISRIKGQLNKQQLIAFNMLVSIDPNGLQQAIDKYVKVSRRRDYYSPSKDTMQTAIVTPRFRTYLRERF